MASLEPIAVNLISSALSTNTTKNYNATLKEYSSFIAKLQPSSQPFPANPGHLVYYIAHLFQRGLVSSTITTKLSSISYFHKIKSYPDPTSSFIVQKALSGAKKLSPSGDSRIPISIPMLQQLMTQIHHTSMSPYAITMMKSMMSLSFYGFLRPGEITDSPNNLLLQQVQLNHDNIVITFTKFKHHVGPPVQIQISAHPGITCPVAALRQFISIRGMRSGPLYSTYTGRTVTYHTLSSWFKSLIIRCDLSPHTNLHSFRIGATTQAFINNIPSTTIQQMGRWNSTPYMKYIRVPRINL